MHTKSKPGLFYYVSDKYKYVMLGGITGAVKTIFHAIFFIKKWVCLEKRIMRSQGDFTAVQLEGVI